MKLIRFKHDTYIWTKEGRSEDSLAVLKNQCGIILGTVEGSRYGWRSLRGLHFIMLLSGKIGWTSFGYEFEVIKEF